MEKLINNFDLNKNLIDDLLQMLSQRSQLDIPQVNEVVSGILNEIRQNGDAALLKYTEKFDGARLSSGLIRVTQKEIDNAFNEIDSQLLGIIEKSYNNIFEFHQMQANDSLINEKPNGCVLGLIQKPLDSVGIYVPGGTAPLVSTVLMNVAPAKCAGVERIVMATPPSKDGTINAAILVAASIAGATEIYKMGGAQAIAALAFGTESVKKVDKIFGPGNIYVATAKRLVFGYCGIDSFAGPSEITVVADETANPKFVAADLLSQAEHDKLASAILVTTSENIANQVAIELKKQLDALPRCEIATQSLKDYGAIVLVKDINQAIEVVNLIAPEHLELCVDNAFEVANGVRHAGAIFVGNYSPEALGDYYAGPNHVLPTSGTARFFSPLNVDDFKKKTSLIYYTEKALREASKDIQTFAAAEKLEAHANSIKVRFENE